METGIVLGFGFCLFFYGVFSMWATLRCSHFAITNAKTKWVKVAGWTIGINMILNIFGLMSRF